ncbi:Alpha/Beta hydrolase protein [Boeremia exigua]|uniref:Alpha/Beta hydrolase protein n=1 Tax=Boeremia exigua TaxID=749465 RepID=UPI001E8D7E59|nr:Alpha/Beta hydrolase protein [Boeremia exigua]KAH6642398.1 Alpha/Beta hydrolase protein [Boeremia exigua]
MQAYRPPRNAPHRTLTLAHPALGSIEGILLPGDKVVQFHAIPYATVPARFQHSILLPSLHGAGSSFTHPGYACPHTFTMDDVHSGGLYPSEPEIESDELKCLTVTLSVPLTLLLSSHGDGTEQERRKVPVMVYIHGGAFHVGKVDAVHDTGPLVAQSIDDEQPVVVASLQYRLGAFGFLATPDGVCNLGLHDQRTGLQWIQRFVGGFGGDEGRVTLFGESAGGYSICYHMLSPPSPAPLFSRAAIMSGVVGPLMVPVAKEEADTAFHELCEILEIKERGHEALTVLSAVPAQQLVKAGDIWVDRGNFWRPVVDPSFFAHDHITWDTVPALLSACPWVSALLVGNTACEGIPYLSVARSLTPLTFRDHMRGGLSHESTARVLETYGITPATDPNLFVHAATRWLGDVIFDAPIHALCNHLAVHADKKVYRYLFDIGNPFIGAPHYKVPHHWVDVYFLFRTLQFRYPSAKLKRLSDQHSKMWVAFANGEAPWAEYRGGDDGSGGAVVMVADEVDGWTEQRLNDDKRGVERNWTRLVRLWDAWGEKSGENWLPLRLAEVVGQQTS